MSSFVKCKSVTDNACIGEIVGDRAVASEIMRKFESCGIDGSDATCVERAMRGVDLEPEKKQYVSCVLECAMDPSSMCLAKCNK